MTTASSVTQKLYKSAMVVLVVLPVLYVILVGSLMVQAEAIYRHANVEVTDELLHTHQASHSVEELMQERAWSPDCLWRVDGKRMSLLSLTTFLPAAALFLGRKWILWLGK